MPRNRAEINIINVDGTPSKWVANPETVTSVLVENFQAADHETNVLTNQGALESGLSAGKTRNSMFGNA